MRLPSLWLWGGSNVHSFTPMYKEVSLFRTCDLQVIIEQSYCNILIQTYPNLNWARSTWLAQLSRETSQRKATQFLKHTKRKEDEDSWWECPYPSWFHWREADFELESASLYFIKWAPVPYWIPYLSHWRSPAISPSLLFFFMEACHHARWNHIFNTTFKSGKTSKTLD